MILYGYHDPGSPEGLTRRWAASAEQVAALGRSAAPGASWAESETSGTKAQAERGRAGGHAVVAQAHGQPDQQGDEDEQAQDLLFQDGGTFIPYQENSRQVLTARVRGIAAVGEDHLRWHLVDLVE